ncbi:signal peptide peptidase SppA, partial [Weeksellaceae bacterium A-14]
KNYIDEIRKLAADDEVKAVVFRINSPGGSANASDEILFELQKLKQKKPLVVSFGDYAASGGYYIAMAADKIYSEPNTLTGSIGVFGLVYNFKDLAHKNGLNSEAVKTNENSNFYSPINGLSDGAKIMMTKSVEQTYKRFVHFVTVNRKKSFEQIDAVGGGRVWSGTRAKAIGLVDELGTLDDAVKFAAQKAKLKEYEVKSYPKKVSVFEQFFNDMNNDELYAKVIRNKIGEDNFKLFQELTEQEKKGKIIMELPFKINIR